MKLCVESGITSCCKSPYVTGVVKESIVKDIHVRVKTTGSCLFTPTSRHGLLNTFQAYYINYFLVCRDVQTQFNSSHSGEFQPKK